MAGINMCRPDDPNTVVVLETQKGRVTVHDIVGISGKRRLQEFVIVGITATVLVNETGSIISE